MLPTQKTPVKNDLASQTILIYGQPGIGKSTIASKFNNALFLATEAGLNNLEVYQYPIRTWEDFLAACKEIAAGKHEFKTIVIDTIDNLHKACREYVAKKNGFAHESDMPFSKGWDLVKSEFLRALTKLSLLPYGLVMISHAEYSEIKTRTATINKAVPTLQKNARNIILGMCDIILYCENVLTEDGEKRIIRSSPAENWEGKDRTGRLPAVLPLDYTAFHNAFTGKTSTETKQKEAKK